jgi:hypothetical protein
VGWSNGIFVRWNETRLFFDPLESDAVVNDVFVSHAHYDHVSGFQFPVQKKYSTKETREIYESDTRKKVGNWQEVRVGRRAKLGGVEVEAHNAGHVLGSVQYEVITPEGSVVYASHLNFQDTLVMRAADVAPCDILVIEAPYVSSTSLPRDRQSVVAEIVRWALECVNAKRIPSFEVDALGNAQELVKIFNTWTNLPVIVHPRIARINKIYESSGIGLHYLDASTEEASKLVEESECIVIVPKRFDTARYGNFRTAYVSNSLPKVINEESKFFQLSDQADLNQLLEFVQETRARAVLTFYGASALLGEMVSKRFKVPARQLIAKRVPRRPAARTLDEARLGRCQELLLKAFEILGYTYDKRELVAMALKEGYRSDEIEETLARLTRGGTIKYVSVVDGYVRS